MRPGDIGLVRLPDGKLYGAVVAESGRWAIKLSHGLTLVFAGEAVAVWRLPPPMIEDEDRMAALRAHMGRMAQTGFAYGTCDCALAVADWVLAATGVDPAAEFRGTYQDEAGWQRIVTRAGGIEVLFGTLAASAGLEAAG